MRDKDNSPNAYRYNLSSPKKERALSIEEEVEQLYKSVRLKLPPQTLRRLVGLNCLILLGVLLVFFLSSLLLEKPTESKIEKRALAQMPAFSAASLFQGRLTRDIENHFADTFPFREWFVSMSAVVNESRGIRVDDVRIIQPSGNSEGQGLPKDGEVKTKTPAAVETPADGASSAASQTGETPSPNPASHNPPVGEGAASPISNGSFVYKGMAMSLFGGNGQSASWYAQVLNAYQSELPDVQIYNMVIPTAIEFYVPDKYRDLTQSQKNIIDLVYSQLNSRIKRVDAYSKLQEHKDEYLYFRTDHHWTGLGAYYAYTAFCEQAGVEPISLADCETRRLNNFIGTMYAQTQDSTLLQNPDYVDYYIFPQEYTATRFNTNSPYSGVWHTLWGEYAQSPNSYSVFLHGDFPLIQVKTSNHNGRKIMIVKESFGNAFAPFLINHYEEVYIVDQRYFQLAAIDFIKSHGINELIFANNSFAVCTPYHIRCIDNLRHQVFVPYVPPAPETEEISSSEEAQELPAEKISDKEKSSKNASSKKSTPRKKLGDLIKENQ
ncbi:DHHW family protein [Oscillospiraceae bacterium PP1C4]